MTYSYIFAIRLNGGATLLIEAPDISLAASFAEECYGDSLVGVSKVGPLSASIDYKDEGQPEGDAAPTGATVH